MIDDFNRAGFITFFTHARSTWDDLEGTGSLRLITNGDLMLMLEKIIAMAAVEVRMVKQLSGETEVLRDRVAAFEPE